MSFKFSYPSRAGFFLHTLVCTNTYIKQQYCHTQYPTVSSLSTTALMSNCSKMFKRSTTPADTTDDSTNNCIQTCARNECYVNSCQYLIVGTFLPDTPLNTYIIGNNNNTCSIYMYTTDPNCSYYGTQWEATFTNTVIYNNGDPSTNNNTKTGMELVSLLMSWYWSITMTSNLTFSTVSLESLGISVLNKYNTSFSNVQIQVQAPGSTGGCVPKPKFSELTPVSNTSCSSSDPIYPHDAYYGDNAPCTQLCPADCYNWLNDEKSSVNYQTYCGTICTSINDCVTYKCNCTGDTTYYMYWPGATTSSYYYQIIFQFNTTNIVFSYGNNSDLTKSIKKYLMWYFEIPSSYFSNFTIVDNYSQVNLSNIMGTFTLNTYNQGIQPQNASGGGCYPAPVYFAINSPQPSSVPTQTYSNGTCTDTPTYIWNYFHS